MTIASIDYRHKAPVVGEFRVRRPEQRIASNGAHYLSLILEDYSGKLRAVAWNNNIAGEEELSEYACITLYGQLKVINGNWLVEVKSAKLLQKEPKHPIHLIPRSIAPVPSALEKLNDLADCISHPALKRFIDWVMTDSDIAFPFIALPASRQHHHCDAGGLLNHSLECVSMVSCFTVFPKNEIELAMVAAMFHDIGKIRTLQSVGKHSSAGHVITHDSLTLEVLAPYLQRLDSICPEAGLALRYLWTWRMQRYNHHPLLTIAEAITAADRISSGLNRQQTAFRNHPDWHTFARNSENSTFWRPQMKLTK